jgi:hypothetical protein
MSAGGDRALASQGPYFKMTPMALLAWEASPAAHRERVPGIQVKATPSACMPPLAGSACWVQRPLA